MKDLDLKDFVVNYTKDDRDHVPNFILSIDYKSFDLKSNISPTSQIILLPPMLHWYVTKHCNVSSNRYTALEMNKIHRLTIDGQELLYFVFLDSLGSTGSAMLLVSISNTVYLITGDSCFSEKLFRSENVSQFGPIDKLYFDGPLFDSSVQWNDIDFICSEMASIIMGTPNKIIIVSDPGLEFILVEVMKLLRPKKKFGCSYANKYTKTITDQLGFGKYFRNTVKASISARVSIYSNLNEIKCNLAAHVGCKLIKLRRPGGWIPGMKAYVKQNQTHIFSVFSHCSRKSFDNIVEIVRPGICVEVLGSLTKECGANINPSKIITGKISTKVSQNSFKKPYDVPRVPPNKAKAASTSLKRINHFTSQVNNATSLVNNPCSIQPACPQYCDEMSKKLLCTSKQTKPTEVLSDLPDVNMNKTTKKSMNQQFHEQPACLQSCEELPPELPCITEQPELNKEVSKHFLLKKISNTTIKNQINIDKNGNDSTRKSQFPCHVSTDLLFKNKINCTLKQQKQIQLEKYDNFKDSKENFNIIQNCTIDNPTNNISVIGYQQSFPCDNCQETTFKLYDTSKQFNTFLEIPANLSIQNEANSTFENNIHIKKSDDNSTLYDEYDNFLSKENLHGILDQRQRCTGVKNFAKINNNGDQHQPNASPGNCEEIVLEHLCIAKPEPITVSSDLLFKYSIDRILKNDIKFEKYSESNCEGGEALLSELLKIEGTFRSTIIDDSLKETDSVKKHFKSFLTALNPAHRLTFIKQMSDKNLSTMFKGNEDIDAKIKPKRICKRKKNHFQNIKSCKRVKSLQYK